MCAPRRGSTARIRQSFQSPIHPGQLRSSPCPRHGSLGLVLRFNPLFIGALRSTRNRRCSIPKWRGSTIVSIPYSSGHFGHRNDCFKASAETVLGVSIPYSSGHFDQRSDADIVRTFCPKFQSPIHRGTSDHRIIRCTRHSVLYSVFLIPYSSGHFDQRDLAETMALNSSRRVSIPYSSGHFDQLPVVTRLRGVPTQHQVSIPYSSGHFDQHSTGKRIGRRGSTVKFQSPIHRGTSINMMIPP